MSNPSKHSCVVGLCIKNNAVGLPKVFENLSKFRTLFDKFMVVAYYDKSDDNSLVILNSLCDKYNIGLVLINKNGKGPVTKTRTFNIANARNNILNFINKNCDEFDLFAMMDSNDYSCQGDIRLDVIEKYLKDEELYNGWDGLSFAREPYYDYWAFSGGIFQISCWCYPYARYNHTKGLVCSAEDFQEDMRKYIYETYFTPENKGKLVPVDSAFCGFAIYKKEAFKGCSYSGRFTMMYNDKELLKQNIQKYRPPINVRPDDCEHRFFHLQAKKENGAKIMVACDQAFEKYDR